MEKIKERVGHISLTKKILINKVTRGRFHRQYLKDAKDRML